MRQDCCPHCGKNFPEDYANELCPTDNKDWKCSGCGKEYKIRIQPRVVVETWEKS